MPTHDQTGPVRMPSGLAVEAPRPAAHPARVKRALGLGVSVLVVGALVAALVVKYTSTADPDPTLDATSNVATPVAVVSDEVALPGGDGPARQVTMSPTGDRVLALRDRGVDVWRLDGTHTAWLAVDGDRVAGAAWSRDGKRLVLWGPDGTVRLWNADTGALVRTIQAGMGFVVRAELTDDDHVLTIGTDGVRRTWDLDSGDVRVQHPSSSRATPVEAPAAPATRTDEAITPDGRWRAFVDARGNVKLEHRPGDATGTTRASATHDGPDAAPGLARADRSI